MRTSKLFLEGSAERSQPSFKLLSYILSHVNVPQVFVIPEWIAVGRILHITPNTFFEAGVNNIE